MLHSQRRQPFNKLQFHNGYSQVTPRAFEAALLFLVLGVAMGAVCLWMVSTYQQILTQQ